MKLVNISSWVTCDGVYHQALGGIDVNTSIDIREKMFLDFWVLRMVLDETS